MSFTKKALMVGGIAAGGVFTACSFVPIVGPLVGLFAGGATFIVVETGALIGLGAYLTGKGIGHGVKHLCKSGCKNKHHHHEHPDPSQKEMENFALKPEKIEPVTVETTQTVTELKENKIDWVIERKASASPVSITKFGIHQNDAPFAKDKEEPVLETGTSLKL